MYTKSRKLVLASAITLALSSISGAVVADAHSQDLVEARQESQISTTYSLSPYLRSDDLKVSVDEGKATLSGVVEEDANKVLAGQIALGVNGVKTVDNQIVVADKYVAPVRKSQERSFGEVVEDATITATVKSKLLWGKSTDGMEMDVDTSTGRVTLRGSAGSDASKALAGRMAADTDGVLSVDNRLVVDSSKPVSKDVAEASEHDTSEDISDSWITTKVTSTFMFSSNVESHDILVSTDKGIVTLSGKVSSGAERDLAIELADNIRGVKSVNSVALTF